MEQVMSFHWQLVVYAQNNPFVRHLLLLRYGSAIDKDNEETWPVRILERLRPEDRDRLHYLELAASGTPGMNRIREPGVRNQITNTAPEDLEILWQHSNKLKKSQKIAFWLISPSAETEQQSFTPLVGLFDAIHKRHDVPITNEYGNDYQHLKKETAKACEKRAQAGSAEHPPSPSTPRQLIGSGRVAGEIDSSEPQVDVERDRNMASSERATEWQTNLDSGQ